MSALHCSFKYSISVVFFLSAGVTCITLHPCDRCRRLCITSKVFRSCHKPRGSHAFLHWYAKILQLDTLSSSCCLFTCIHKSGLNICELNWLAGWVVSHSASQSVCAYLSMPFIQYVSRSVSQHVCLPTCQSVNYYTSHIWFLFPLYVHETVCLSFANKYVFSLTSFSLLQCTSSLNNVMCGFVATQTLLQVQNLFSFLLSQYFFFHWLWVWWLSLCQYFKSVYYIS